MARPARVVALEAAASINVHANGVEMPGARLGGDAHAVRERRDAGDGARGLGLAVSRWGKGGAGGRRGERGSQWGARKVRERRGEGGGESEERKWAGEVHNRAAALGGWEVRFFPSRIAGSEAGGDGVGGWEAGDGEGRRCRVIASSAEQDSQQRSRTGPRRRPWRGGAMCAWRRSGLRTMGEALWVDKKRRDETSERQSGCDLKVGALRGSGGRLGPVGAEVKIRLNGWAIKMVLVWD